MLCRARAIKLRLSDHQNGCQYRQVQSVAPGELESVPPATSVYLKVNAHSEGSKPHKSCCQKFSFVAAKQTQKHQPFLPTAP